MAERKEVQALVARLLRSYPQLKFTAESIQGFIDELAPKLKNYPGWLLDQAADEFITTEVDFPKFNIASILAYCWRVRSWKMDGLKNRLQTYKDDWNIGKLHDSKEWEALIADFRRINAVEFAQSVEERIEHYTRQLAKPTPEQIAVGKAAIEKLTQGMSK
jgi:hypothetical protein